MKISIFGAPLDTGNLGVSALGCSIITEIHKRFPDAVFTLFDYGKGVRKKIININGENVVYSAVGCVLSKRIYRKDNLWNIKIRGILGNLNSPVIRELRESICILDVTGGDSFTDIYGLGRLRSSLMRKEIVIKQKKPLILMPQTFGPFNKKRYRNKVKHVIESSSMVWTRDKKSDSIIENLFNGTHPPNCKSGVDVAFLLLAVAPTGKKKNEIEKLFSYSHNNKVGVNISGLFIDGNEGNTNFILKTDYYLAIKLFIEWLIKNTDTSVYLVAHVDTDVVACKYVYNSLNEKAKKQVSFLQTKLNQNEIKWFISKMDWFCGARMHSTIAALSSLVPAVVLAYSDKAEGVFGLCDQMDNVIDMRKEDTETVVNNLINSWKSRAEIKTRLYNTIPKIIEKANYQMDEIASFCKNAAEGKNA